MREVMQSMFTASICNRLAAFDRVIDKPPLGIPEEDIQESGECIRDAVDEMITTIVTVQVGNCLDLGDIILETQDAVWPLMGMADWSHPDMPSWLNDTTSDAARAISRRYAMART